MERSKGIFLSLILCISVIVPGFGMKYQIKLLNTPTITINGEKAKVGDWFDDKAVITWDNEKQAMKVLSEDNHIYTLSAKTYKNNKANTFLDYIVAVKPMIARGNASIKERLEELQYAGCVLMDSLYLDFSDTEIPADDILTGEIIDFDGNPFTFGFIKNGNYLVMSRDSLLPIIEKIEGDVIEISIYNNGKKVIEGFEIEISK